MFEEGKDLPIGMSRRSVQGVDRTFLNCAVCHVSTVRDAPGAKPEIVLGMPANTFNLFGVPEVRLRLRARPEVLDAEYVVPEIDRLMRAKGERLELLDRYVVYPVAIAIMRDRLLMLYGRLGPLLEDRPWGPGRSDTFNADQDLFNFPLDKLPARERTRPRLPLDLAPEPRQRACSSTGTATTSTSEERNKSAAFGTGTTPPTIDLAAHRARRRVAARPRSRRSIRYPIDASSAGRGAPIYAHTAPPATARAAELRGAGGTERGA